MSPLTPNTTAKNATSPASTMRPVTRNSLLLSPRKLLSSPRKRGPSIPERLLSCTSTSVRSVFTGSPLARGRHRGTGSHFAIIPSRSAEMIGRTRPPPRCRVGDPKPQIDGSALRQHLIGAHQHPHLTGLIGADRNDHGAAVV